MTADLFAPLTAAERDTLRRFMHRGDQEAFKLAGFAASAPDLFRQAYDMAREVADLHVELCALDTPPALVPSGTGWPVGS